MPGVNLLGGNSNDYVLGRGIVYFEGETLSGATYSNAYRDLGNATEFTIAIESETKEHQSSLEGLKTTDLEVLLSQKMTVNFTLDELNDNNQALFFLGTNAGGDQAAGGGTSIANGATIDSDASGVGLASSHFVTTTSPGMWLWYDIELTLTGGTKLRCYDFAASQITGSAASTNPGNEVTLDPGSSDLELTEETASQNGDYELDRAMGRIRLIPGGPADLTAAKLNGKTVEVAWTAHPDTVEAVREGDGESSTDGTDQYLSRVGTLLNSGVTGKLKFIQENPVNNIKTEYWFPQVTLKPDGDFSGIGDEFTTLSFTGAVEKFTGTLPYQHTSQFLNITTRKTFGTE